MRIFLSFLLIAFFVAPATAQEEFPHPELVWKTLETEHFLVHFHDGSERTAQEVAGRFHDADTVRAEFQQTLIAAARRQCSSLPLDGMGSS